MAKTIKYQFVSCEVNRGTDEKPNIEQIIIDAEIICQTQEEYDNNYPIAEKEAVPGTIEVSGEFDAEPETPSDGGTSVWDELDAAYQEGVDSI